eukprot:scaffold33905_cov26-Tisochrysis_lutea.AAC.1
MQSGRRPARAARGAPVVICRGSTQRMPPGDWLGQQVLYSECGTHSKSRESPREMSATYSPPCVYRSTAQRAPKPRNIAMSGGASVSPGRIQSSASMNSTTSSEPTTTQKESAAATSAPLLSSGIAALLEGPLGLGESLALPNARQAPFSLAALSAVRKSGRLSGRALTSKSVLAASADRGSLRPVISLTNSTALPAASALPPLESRESRTALYRSAGARDENASSNLEPKGVMEEEEGPSESDGGGERREECDEKRR